MMRLCDDALIPQYKKLVDVIHAESCPVITQLALSAYYREVNGRDIQVEPDDMTEEEIKAVIRQFVEAGIMAERAGFDDVQIYAAHFFFLSRFISPAVNHRSNEYGGENRSRILLDIMKGIREAAPSLHITIKINCSDFTYSGLDKSECLDLCKLLDQAGIDSIEVSGNGTSVSGIKTYVNEGYFVSPAAKIADAVPCPVIVVCGFRSLDTMESVLNQTKREMVSMSRPLLREPDLPNKMLADPTTLSKCISCNRCYSSPSRKCFFEGREQA